MLVRGRSPTGLIAPFRVTVERVTTQRTPHAHRPPIEDLLDLLTACGPIPRLIALGEPTHGDATFLALRNDLVARLADAGALAAVALETAAGPSRRLDDYVCGRSDDLDGALREGFTHGFGTFAGNRELLETLRAVNDARSAAEHIRCVGIDAAMELTAEDYALPERAQQRMVERTVTMADHVDALLSASDGSGTVLLFAHDSHVQRARSSMRLGPAEIAWNSLGTVLAERHGDACTVVLMSGSELPAHGVPRAPAGTLEHLLDDHAGGAEALVVPASALADLIDERETPLRVRDDLTPAMALGPLDPEAVATSADALVHVPRGERGALLGQDRIRAMLGALPDVQVQVAGPDDGSPEIAWGDTFLTVQPAGHEDPRRMPFATLVTQDYPGFDETSELDREGSFALNLRVGPQIFPGLLGVAPRESAALLARLGPATRGVMMPHPDYAAQGWVRVIDPPEAMATQIAGLAGAIVQRTPRE